MLASRVLSTLASGIPSPRALHTASCSFSDCCHGPSHNVHSLPPPFPFSAPFSPCRRGSREGDRLVFEEEGEETVDTQPGDLVLLLRQKPHPLYRRTGGWVGGWWGRSAG